MGSYWLMLRQGSCVRLHCECEALLCGVAGPGQLRALHCEWSERLIWIVDLQNVLSANTTTANNQQILEHYSSTSQLITFSI